jgi:DNA-binding response OmpR family regulator
MGSNVSKILVVDDNQDVRELIVHILKNAGFEVSEASDGEKALQILSAISFDLVLLDVMMPGISGLEVLQKIRTGTNKKIRDIPVMMLTAKSSINDVDLALAIGANSYVVKPFRSNSIKEKVQALLDQPNND